MCRLTDLNEEMIKEFYEYDLVMGDGNINSKILLIGEAPGAKEIELKKPFVGKAGENLNEFLEIICLDRKDIYISNTVKFRPTKLSPKTNKPINRPPKTKEINSFIRYLFKEISIVNPQIIVTLGNTPLKAVMSNNKATIGEMHGKITEIAILDNSYKLFPLYHPASIIYNQKLKVVYLEDLEKLKDIVRGI
ncbi:uracil-DNA glycosylase [Clostridiaceae bacterium M8S5]|nr:uracil-DNA glycosylase [Clostridiaceae bacterium M8S5]